MLGDSVAIAEDDLGPFNLKCRCVYIEGFNPEALARRKLHKHCAPIVLALSKRSNTRVRERSTGSPGVAYRS